MPQNLGAALGLKRLELTGPMEWEVEGMESAFEGRVFPGRGWGCRWVQASLWSKSTWGTVFFKAHRAGLWGGPTKQPCGLMQ